MWRGLKTAELRVRMHCWLGSHYLEPTNSYWVILCATCWSRHFCIFFFSFGFTVIMGGKQCYCLLVDEETEAQRSTGAQELSKLRWLGVVELGRRPRFIWPQSQSFPWKVTSYSRLAVKKLFTYSYPLVVSGLTCSIQALRCGLPAQELWLEESVALWHVGS